MIDIPYACLMHASALATPPSLSIEFFFCLTIFSGSADFLTRRCFSPWELAIGSGAVPAQT
jgi:hypothetical protein